MINGILTIGEDIVDFEAMSDRAIVREIGHRIKRYRLDRNLSQQSVADQAGIARSTLVKIEKGHPSGFITVIQILRVLGLLDELNSLLPEPGPSPLQLARLKGKERQRASRRRPVVEG